MACLHNAFKYVLKICPKKISDKKIEEEMLRKQLNRNDVHSFLH